MSYPFSIISGRNKMSLFKLLEIAEMISFFGNCSPPLSWRSPLVNFTPRLSLVDLYCKPKKHFDKTDDLVGYDQISFIS